ncbi:MAG: DUF2190 domain-containing protein [Methylomarinum sp.]|nr:DUF2190 domain-containing protein [Methylomarinum sp.]
MPALKKPILTLAVLASATITEFGAIDYDGTVPASGDTMQGLAVTDGVSGDLVATDVLGTSIAIAGGPVAIGAELQVGTGAKLITKAAGLVVARALQAAAADGDQFEVMLLPR